MNLRLLIYITLVSVASAAGVLAHIEVVRRATYTLSLLFASEHESAQTDFAKWLNKNIDYTQAGTFFPDWGYGCLSNDEEAEAAHWPPFVGAAIDHLLETHRPLNTSLDAQQLLSFIFGLTSHQNTDATWHSIKMRNGLLRAVADSDFDTDYEGAHSILDIGGDTMLAKEFSVSQDDGFAHLARTWSVPVRDITAIYAKLGYSISNLKLRYCMTRGFAAVAALQSVGAALSGRYQSQSPFMTRGLERHFLGSLGEASITTVLCWKSLQSWIISEATPDKNATWHLCEPMRTIARRGKAGPYASHSLAWYDVQPQVAFVRHAKDNRRFDPSDIFAEYEQMIEEEMKQIIVTENVSTGTIQISSTKSRSYDASIALAGPSVRSKCALSYFLTPSIPYAEFGTSITILDTSTHRALAVGSPKDTDSASEPARGGTYVIPLESADLTAQNHNRGLLITNPVRDSGGEACDTSMSSATDETDKVQAQFDGSVSRSRGFGQSIVNFTLSGVPCLAILSSRKVEIFRSSNGSISVKPDISIIDSTFGAQSFVSPPLASELYSFVLDGTSILAIASPWSDYAASGRVYLFSSKSLFSGTMYLNQADLVVNLAANKRVPSAHFGSALAFSKEHHMLFIGVAGSRQVICYKLDRLLRSAKELFRLEDPSLEDRLDTGFGSSGLLIVGNFLYVGSKTQDSVNSQVGLVRVYHFCPLYKKNSFRRNIPWTIKIVREIRPDNDMPFSHFGHKIIRADQAGGVYITAPNYDDRGAVYYVPSLTSSKPRFQHQTIRNRLLNINSGRPQRVKPIFNLALSPCLLGYDTGSKFGDAIVTAADGLVVVGAPYEQGLSTDHRRAGKAYLYDGLFC